MCSHPRQRPQQPHRSRLAQRLVPIAAFGRLHAGGAPALAGAGSHRIKGGRDPGGEALEAAVGKPGSAGVAVIHKDGG